jgi:hypothetical protein
MFHAIPRRHTNRHPFETRPVPDRLLTSLRAAADMEGAVFTVISDEKLKGRAVELVWHSDRAQMANRSFRRELAAWLHSGRSATRAGIPGLRPGHEGTSRLPLHQPTPPPCGHSTSAKVSPRIIENLLRDRLSSPCLPPKPIHQPIGCRSGRSARVLLLACANRVSASFLNQPLEVEELRPQFREALGLSGFAQILLRMGYGPEVKPTPRREVRELLI